MATATRTGEGTSPTGAATFRAPERFRTGPEGTDMSGGTPFVAPQLERPAMTMPPAPTGAQLARRAALRAERSGVEPTPPVQGLYGQHVNPETRRAQQEANAQQAEQHFAELGVSVLFGGGV